MQFPESSLINATTSAGDRCLCDCAWWLHWHSTYLNIHYDRRHVTQGKVSAMVCIDAYTCMVHASQLCHSTQFALRLYARGTGIRTLRLRC